MLRYTLLLMTLDIEHFAKVKLMRILAERDDEDGYSIVSDYLNGLDHRERAIRASEIERLKKDRYCGPMARKYLGRMPAWVFLELVSLGTFIDFYRFCASRWDDGEMRKEHYLLRQVFAKGSHSREMTRELVDGFLRRSRSHVEWYEKNKPVKTALSFIGLIFDKWV